jgi:replicative superfamily II helicase
MTETTDVPNLVSRIPEGGTDDPDRILDLFLEWVAEIGFELYPAQEEALLELMAGRHLVLSTPTGSGKSLVALGLHFKGLCEGRVSYYTSPIKALASEKFFSLCNDLGADNVGMLTGDASINPDASVICCTAEVLANLSLRLGSDLNAPYVVMDEFHYYADRDRGWAWQVPLVNAPTSQFLLMSATLGDMTTIMAQIEERTRREIVHVTSAERPVPLDFSYRETPIHETVEWLAESKKAPIYVVNFTQRECAELAQALTSMPLTTKEEKTAIKEAVGETRFTTPYGKEFRRFLSFGIGVHHAGLLPKYRLLVEKLAQHGLLKIISGTDTLGVGVNIPIRTVLFTKLAKFDGEKVTQLKVRDFKQIAGRAGRKGFDDQGSVVAQAPDHVIEKIVADRKAAANPKKKKKGPPKQPRAGEVSWSEDTFKNFIANQPERLVSRFRITPGMMVDLLQRDAAVNDPMAGNFHSLRELIRHCHDDDAGKASHLNHAAKLARSLEHAGIIKMVRDTESPYYWVVVNDDLQFDFSLFHNLSLFLIEAIEGLDPDDPDFALDLLSLVESVLEDPTIVLRRQLDVIKTELINRLKAEGVSYDERMNQLDQVTPPQPRADYLFAVFERFRKLHPWVGGDMVKPKSIGREMIEDYLDFGDYVKKYGLHRFEGVLLRYLSQLYKTLDQNVPELVKDDAVLEVLGYFRSMLERVDTSLIEEWEGLRHPELRLEQGVEDSHDALRLLAIEELRTDDRKLSSRVRAEMRQLVRALSQRDWEAAEGSVRQADDETARWPGERFSSALAPFFERFDTLVFDHRARLNDTTVVSREGDKRWKITQNLFDPEGENLWYIEGEVDLDQWAGGPLVAVTEIGS